MTKHTPAPWVLFNTQIGYLISKEGEEIAEMVGKTKKTEANAILISAAPDMLEALTQVIHDLDCMGKISDSAEIKARAAIAKATGD